MTAQICLRRRLPLSFEAYVQNGAVKMKTFKSRDFYFKNSNILLVYFKRTSNVLMLNAMARCMLLSHKTFFDGI